VSTRLAVDVIICVPSRPHGSRFSRDQGLKLGLDALIPRLLQTYIYKVLVLIRGADTLVIMCQNVAEKYACQESI